jgi:hypothetical protein
VTWATENRAVRSVGHAGSSVIVRGSNSIGMSMKHHCRCCGLGSSPMLWTSRTVSKEGDMDDEYKWFLILVAAGLAVVVVLLASVD